MIARRIIAFGVARVRSRDGEILAIRTPLPDVVTGTSDPTCSARRSTRSFRRQRPATRTLQDSRLAVPISGRITLAA